MATRKILAPHKEQERAVYLRALRVPTPSRGLPPFVNADADEYVDGDDYFLPTRSGKGIVVSYDDGMKASRTISSVRVEQAVETWDYLQLCAEEELFVCMSPLSCKWLVYYRGIAGVTGYGTTLREAYHRYKAMEADHA